MAWLTKDSDYDSPDHKITQFFDNAGIFRKHPSNLDHDDQNVAMKNLP